ncbi:Protein-lysine N-methyltransferase N6amt2 [Smittium mucronatum]|uniref:Protein-lysine N-methyltransferase N6amt2 n=1 Tax=Smittium mucronatum TaxID=133383 RepID=A0A1R0H892_9FUNG|nr:Protein-lysine N-methyltransferase N6amt2 [Smittium mucronatum]
MSDDDMPVLSADTLSILQSFYKEQQEQQSKLQNFQEYSENLIKSSKSSNRENLDQNGPENDEDEKPEGMKFFNEDWQLSQFWYDIKTCVRLCGFAQDSVSRGKMVVFVSCPTAFVKFTETWPEYKNVRLLEYDSRFSVYKEKFIKYDYNHPTEIPHLDNVGIVFLDPPFLNEDTLNKSMTTVQLLASKPEARIVLITGAIMLEVAANHGLHESNFYPTHSSKINNTFYCYTNFQTKKLKWV